MPKKLKVEITLEDKLSGTMSLVRQKVNGFVHSVNRTFRSIMSVPAIVMGIIGGAVGALAKSFITTAEKMEIFERQLYAVTKTAQEAKDAFSAIQEFGRTSPLETEDVVKAYVRLRAVGIDPTMEQMKTLGGVALLFNTNLEEMANAFISTNKKTLRMFGVEISRTKTQATIASGDFKKTVANDSGEIRKTLLELWEHRFPKVIEKMSGTFSGQMLILKSNVTKFQAHLGAQFLPAFTAMVTKTGTFIEGQIKHINKYAAAIFGIVALIRTWWNNTLIVLRTIDSGIIQIIMTLGILAKTASNVINSIGNGFMALSNIFQQMAKGRFDLVDMFKEEFGKAGFDKIWTDITTGLENITTLQNTTAKMNVKDAQDIINAWKAVGKAYSQKIEPPKLDLPGTGKNLGGMGDDEEGSGKEKKITDSLLEGYRIGLELREKLQREAEENATKETEKMIEKRLEIVKQLRVLEIGEDRYNYEQRLNEMKLYHDQGIISTNEYETLITDIKKRESERRLNIQKEEIWATINANMRLGSALNNLAVIGLKNSKIAAKKRQNILIALAVAEAAASAVTAAKAGWDTGITFYDKAFLAAAGIIEAVGMVAGQIATIKSQKFARGTSFYPGGRALVGEEGPEMAEFPRGTRIRTAAETRQTFGGTTISPTVIINGNADRNTVNQIQNALTDFGKKFQQAIRTGNIDLKQLGIVTR